MGLWDRFQKEQAPQPAASGGLWDRFQADQPEEKTASLWDQFQNEQPAGLDDTFEQPQAPDTSRLDATLGRKMPFSGPTQDMLQDKAHLFQQELPGQAPYKFQAQDLGQRIQEEAKRLPFGFSHLANIAGNTLRAGGQAVDALDQQMGFDSRLFAKAAAYLPEAPKVSPEYSDAYRHAFGDDGGMPYIPDQPQQIPGLDPSGNWGPRTEEIAQQKAAQYAAEQAQAKAFSDPRGQAREKAAAYVQAHPNEYSMSEQLRHLMGLGQFFDPATPNTAEVLSKKGYGEPLSLLADFATQGLSLGALGLAGKSARGLGRALDPFTGLEQTIGEAGREAALSAAPVFDQTAMTLTKGRAKARGGVAPGIQRLAEAEQPAAVRGAANLEAGQAVQDLQTGSNPMAQFLAEQSRLKTADEIRQAKRSPGFTFTDDPDVSNVAAAQKASQDALAAERTYDRLGRLEQSAPGKAPDLAAAPEAKTAGGLVLPPGARAGYEEAVSAREQNLQSLLEQLQLEASNYTHPPASLTREIDRIGNELSDRVSFRDEKPPEAPFQKPAPGPSKVGTERGNVREVVREPEISRPTQPVENKGFAPENAPDSANVVDAEIPSSEPPKQETRTPLKTAEQARREADIARKRLTEPVDPATVGVDAETYQFKAGGDAQGVTDRLRDVKKWESHKAGTVVVHERADGSRWIADGHQRLGLAKRAQAAGQEDVLMNAQVYRERDGHTAADVRRYAAEKNLGEGSGTAIDAAKVLKDSPESSFNLPASNQVVRDGRELAKLGDKAFTEVVNGAIPESYAAHVGKLLSKDEEQVAAIQALRRYEPSNSAQAESIVRDIREQGLATRTEQGTLFGDVEHVEDLLGERAKIFDSAQQMAKGDKALFSRIVEGSSPLERAGNKLAKEANASEVDRNARLLAALDEAKYVGPVNQKLNELAREMKAGNLSRPEATRQFLAAVETESKVGQVAKEAKYGNTLFPETPGVLQSASINAGAGARGQSTTPRPPAPPANAPRAPRQAIPTAPSAPPVGAIGSAVGRGAVAEAKSIQEISRDISAAMKKHMDAGGISYGKLSPGAGGNTATGAAHIKRDLVEIRHSGDLGAVTHEVAHIVDAKTNWTKVTDPKLRAELELMGDPATAMTRSTGKSSWQPGMSLERKRQEGFAEFNRLWMAHPAEAQKLAPELYKKWEQWLDDSKDIGRELRRSKADIQTRMSSEAQSRLRGQIAEDRLSHPWGAEDVRAQAFDRFRSLEVMKNVLEEKGARLKPSENPYLTARLLAGTENVAAQFLERAPLAFGTRKPIPGAKGFKQILEPLEQDPEKYLDFRDYLVARRAHELHGRGMKSGIDPADALDVYKKHNTTEFQAMAKDIYAWQDHVLQYAVDGGFLSKDGFARIKAMNENYVPFHRIYEVSAGQESTQFRGTGKGLQASDQLRKIKGSNREIVDPIETMIGNAAALITATEKNQVGRILLKHWDEQREGIGHFIKEVSPPTKIQQVHITDAVSERALRKELEALGIDTSIASKADLQAMMDLMPEHTVMRNSTAAPAGPNQIRVKEGDDWRYIEFQDPSLHKAMTSMDEDQVHFVVNGLAGFANVLRKGATTYNPLFVFNNLVRDSIESGIISRVGSKPIANSLMGARILMDAHLHELATKMGFKPQGAWTAADELLQQFVRNGGMQGFDEGLTSTVGLRRAYNKIMGPMSPKAKAMMFVPDYARPYVEGAVKVGTALPRGIMSVLHSAAEFSEQATRMGEFAKAKEVLAKRNPTWAAEEIERAAAFESRDLLDFSMRGSHVRTARRLIPFLGADLSANYRFFKMFEEAGKTSGPAFVRALTGRMAGHMGMAAAALTVPTIGLWMANRNDPDYNHINQHEKDLMWHLRVAPGPDGFLRIPKPHLPGVMFATIPERLLTWADKHDPKAFDGLIDTFADQGLGPLGLPIHAALSDDPIQKRFAESAALLGPLLKTVMEIATNRNTFTGREIESPWENDPQKNSFVPSYLRSDEYSSLTGKTAARLLRHVNIPLSPKQIDHAIRGMTGNGGVMAARIADLGLSKLTGEPMPQEREKILGGLLHKNNFDESERRFKDVIGSERARVNEQAQTSDIEPDKSLRDELQTAEKQLKDLHKELRQEKAPDKIQDLRMQIRALAGKYAPAPGDPRP